MRSSQAMSSSMAMRSPRPMKMHVISSPQGRRPPQARRSPQQTMSPLHMASSQFMSAPSGAAFRFRCRPRGRARRERGASMRRRISVPHGPARRTSRRTWLELRAGANETNQSWRGPSLGARGHRAANVAEAYRWVRAEKRQRLAQADRSSSATPSPPSHDSPAHSGVEDVFLFEAAAALEVAAA